MSYVASKYPLRKLSELTGIQAGFTFKSEKFTDVLSDIPLVKGENLQPGYIDWSVSKFWPAADFGLYEKYHLEPGDVVLAMDRPWVTAGLKWAYIKRGDPKSLLVQRVARLRSKSGLSQTYLRCLISSNYFSSYIQPIVTGVNIPHISGKQIGDFPAPLPPSDTQEKIAASLSAYDDLIENTRRRIGLLEQVAEELYREWFVRFRFPGYEQAKFRGGVPVGWDVAEALNYFNYVKGKSYKGEELSERKSDMPFVTLKSFNKGGGYREEGLKRYSGRFKPEQVAYSGDIVMAVTDMTQEREVVGRVARIPNIGERGAVISLDVIKLVPKNISASYLYSYMRLSGFGRHVKEFANGTNVLHLNSEVVMKQKIIMPPEHLREKFSDIVNPIHSELDALANSCKNLATQRDMLLPRLISGKLPVDQLDIQFPPSMREADAARQEVAHA